MDLLFACIALTTVAKDTGNKFEDMWELSRLMGVFLHVFIVQEMAMDCLRVEKVVLFGEYLCGIEPPMLSFDVEKGCYFSVAPAPVKSEEKLVDLKTDDGSEVSCLSCHFRHIQSNMQGPSRLWRSCQDRTWVIRSPMEVSFTVDVNGTSHWRWMGKQSWMSLEGRHVKMQNS